MGEDIAFIGTGDPDGDGFAMSYQHARAFDNLDGCRLVACTDIVQKNAEKFATEYEIDPEHAYEDHEEMLAAVDPDVVSVCTPPETHADIALDCLNNASVQAIHCEKPMAKTWKDSRRMTLEFQRRGAQLTFNHQRRFGEPWRRAKELLDEGRIGPLQRIETTAPNLYDWGSHCFDLCCYFNDEHAAEWVIGQIDYREENLLFGAHNENQAVVQFEYENGVHGTAYTGFGSNVTGCLHKLIGAEGVIEVMVEDGPDLRVRSSATSGWETIDCPGQDYWISCVDDAVEEAIDALRTGYEPEIGARNTLNATEIIFAAWESSKRRGRVDLPLEIDGNPLEEMVDEGTLNPSTPS